MSKGRRFDERIFLLGILGHDKYDVGNFRTHVRKFRNRRGSYKVFQNKYN
jgi:hypothetical protein